MSEFKNSSISTKLIHGGISTDSLTGAVNVPTIILFKNGEVVHTAEGLQKKNQIKEIIDKV